MKVLVCKCMNRYKKVMKKVERDRAREGVRVNEI